MNESKSRQGEGYDLYDYRELAFPAAGLIEAPYMVGFEQNVAIQGAWPSESVVYPGTAALTANIAPGVVVIPIAPPSSTAPFIGLPVGTPLVLMDQVNSQFVVLALAVVLGDVTVTVAAPGSFVAYTVANNAVLIGPTYLPVDAQNTLFFADVACNIRLVSRSMAAQQVLGVLPVGVPAQITIPAVTWITYPDKWYVIYAVAVGAVAGTLIIKTSG